MQVVNSNPLLPVQWAAVFMVFSGLLTSTLLKGTHHSAASAAGISKVKKG
jgi:hypothetical protein